MGTPRRCCTSTITIISPASAASARPTSGSPVRSCASCRLQDDRGTRPCTQAGRPANVRPNGFAAGCSAPGSTEETMTDKTYENVKIERDGEVTFVVLNRPEKRNAMSPGLHYDVEDALLRLDDDPQTKVLVLAGAGEAWCAGQDLKLYFRETANNPVERKRSNTASHHWRHEILTKFTKPTIAMVNGYCFGGAFTQLCSCDFAVAAEDAIFGLSEVNWGILPGGIVSWNLTDMLLPRHAMYYAATGEPFDGKRAVEIGLVNFAVPKAQLREK